MIRNETKLFRGSNASIFGRVWTAEQPDNFEHGYGALPLRHGAPTASSHPSRNIVARFSEDVPRGESRLRVRRAADLATEISHEASRKCARDEMRGMR
jgi:hypothetical protein